MESPDVNVFEAEPEPEEQSVASQWLGRIVVTIILAVLYHLWEKSNTQPESTRRLMEEQELLVMHDEKNELTNNTMTMIYDDIEDDNKMETDSETLIYDDIEEDQNEDCDDLADEKEDCEADSEHPDCCATHQILEDPNETPKIEAKDSYHPGLDGFWQWYTIEASLYRVYSVGRTDGVEVSPPFIPKSERGHVTLTLQVSNSYRSTISAYWIDYKGNEIHKGNVKHGGVFHQTTWIGHPWIFRDKESGAMLCHYIPYKIIPTSHQVPTIDPQDPGIGIHQFAISSLAQRSRINNDGAICTILDPVFPTVIDTTQDAAAWSFQEMARQSYPYVDSLTKYLTNIVLHPADTKYRQIRIAHKRFSQHVWSTPARGIFLAAGFVEAHGFAELGSNESLPRSRVQDLSTLLFYLEKWKRIQDASPRIEQPEGVDGYGRANFGRR